jgi:inorganic pyrophosphatase
LERLQHYFLTYKMAPNEERGKCEITGIYGTAEAHDVIRRSQEDYLVRYGHVAGLIRAGLAP